MIHPGVAPVLAAGGVWLHLSLVLHLGGGDHLLHLGLGGAGRGLHLEPGAGAPGLVVAVLHLGAHLLVPRRALGGLQWSCINNGWDTHLGFNMMLSNFQESGEKKSIITPITNFCMDQKYQDCRTL